MPGNVFGEVGMYLENTGPASQELLEKRSAGERVPVPIFQPPTPAENARVRQTGAELWRWSVLQIPPAYS